MIHHKMQHSLRKTLIDYIQTCFTMRKFNKTYLTMYTWYKKRFWKIKGILEICIAPQEVLSKRTVTWCIREFSDKRRLTREPVFPVTVGAYYSRCGRMDLARIHKAVFCANTSGTLVLFMVISRTSETCKAWNFTREVPVVALYT